MNSYIVPEQYKNNKHFWRGMLDGDGCIFLYKYKKEKKYGFNIVGTKNVIENFITYCSEVLKKPIDVKMREINKTSNTYSISLCGKKYFNVLTELYSDLTSNLFFDRKYNIYNQILNFRKDMEHK